MACHDDNEPTQNEMVFKKVHCMILSKHIGHLFPKKHIPVLCMFNDIYNNYHRHSILLKREPGLSSNLKVLSPLKKIIYNKTKFTTGMYNVSL